MPVASLVEPTFRRAPEYAQTDGPLVTELGGLCGFEPDPEQRLVLDDIFAIGDDGKAAAFEVGLIACRQNLKTGVLKLAALGKLFIAEQRLVVWSAHEFRASQEAFRDLRIMLESAPDLEREVLRVTTATGSEGIELTRDRRLIFKARTTGSGRSLSGDTVILDEGFALQPAHMGALVPTLAARPDPQLLYGSSAGMATSDVLRSLRDRGRAGAPRLAYSEWCAPRRSCSSESCQHQVGSDGCALDDVELWWSANTALHRGRITLDTVAGMRQAMPPEQFMRECLGWWDEPEGSAAVFGAGKWEACPDAPKPAGLPLGALAVAVSFDQMFAAVGGAALDKDSGLVFVRPMAHGPGTAWVPELVRDLQGKHRVPVVLDEKGPAASLIPALDGLRLRLLGVDDVTESCAHVFSLVQEAKVAHERYPELERAIAGAVKRPIGDRWAWGRRQSSSDISVLEAVTLAAWEASVHAGYDLMQSFW